MPPLPSKFSRPAVKPIRRSVPIDPYWATTDGETVRIYHGHVTDRLRELPAESVQCVVTSPPYWGLRDYGTGTWMGGDEGCDHKSPSLPTDMKDRGSSTLGGDSATQNTAKLVNGYRDICGKCGATRTDQQLGSEPSPDCGTHGKAQCGKSEASGKRSSGGCFVCSMVGVFSEVRRVLRDDGTLWLNLGDTYSSKPPGTIGQPRSERGWSEKINSFSDRQSEAKDAKRDTVAASGLPSGNLVGIPWRVALALQANGWILRQDIIWSKPSPMPESVRNRCTKAHEYVFLFVKKMGYFYDAEAIRDVPSGRTDPITSFQKPGGDRSDANKTYQLDGLVGRNKRSVWSVASYGYPGAHFATYPPKLIEPMILAGTSAKGACAECEAPWKRVVETEQVRLDNREVSGITHGGDSMATGAGSKDGGFHEYPRTRRVDTTLGWEPTCECNGKFVRRKGTRMGYGSYHGHSGDGVEYGYRQSTGGPVSGSDLAKGKVVVNVELPTTIIEYISDLPLDQHPIRPCMVLDPFLGSGTTAEVCLNHDRRCWGIELSEKYIVENAIPRIESTLFSRPSTAHLSGRKTEKVTLPGRNVTS